VVTSRMSRVFIGVSVVVHGASSAMRRVLG
jgi:hypothetical protein